MNSSSVLIDQAVGVATSSDVAIVFVGDNMDTCQEAFGLRTGDRADLDLPGLTLPLSVDVQVVN